MPTDHTEDQPPIGRFRGKYFEDFALGEEFHSAGRTITEADVVDFANLSWDHNPIHVNEEFASRTIFRSRIAHGALTLAVATFPNVRLAGEYGVTCRVTPSGAPYIVLDVGAGLAPGAFVDRILEFDNPDLDAIGATFLVHSGSGSR